MAWGWVGARWWEQRPGSGCAPHGCGFCWEAGREHLFLASDTAKGQEEDEVGVERGWDGGWGQLEGHWVDLGSGWGVLGQLGGCGAPSRLKGSP